MRNNLKPNLRSEFMQEPKEQALILELEQVHDCCTVSVTDKDKDAKIKWLANTGHDQKCVYNLFELTSNDPKKFIEHLKSHPEVLEVKTVSINENRAYIIIASTRKSSTAVHLAKSGTAWIEPTWSSQGADHVTMLAPDFKSFKKFLESVEGKYDIKVKSKRYLDPKTELSLNTFLTSGFLQLKTASEMLTNKQMEAFDIACKYGYYENPKKITLMELAQKLDTTEAALSELLRKAEKKLLPILSDIVRMMR